MNYANLNADFVWSIDIETVRNDKAKSYHEFFSINDIKAPSNYKDEAKIAEYIREKTEQLGSKDALSWFTGKIVSIAMVNVADVINNVKKPRMFCYAGTDEKKIIESIVADINNTSNSVFQLVGKSSSMFDYPFMRGRSLVHSIPLPTIMKNPYNLLDIDQMICHKTGSSQTGKLDEYLFCIGEELKIMKGNEVQGIYDEAVLSKAKDQKKYVELITKIRDYNIDDAIKTAKIAGRLLH